MKPGWFGECCEETGARRGRDGVVAAGKGESGRS